MIRAFDLFHRSVMTPREKKVLKNAQNVANIVYAKRFESPYKENWTEKPEEVTLESVENYVVRAIKLGEDFYEN